MVGDIESNTAPNHHHTMYVTTLIAELEWIKSIVEVEFDYHLGERECMLKKNAKYMKEYGATQISGYGPLFYNELIPSNNISHSKLAQLLYPCDDEIRSKKKKSNRYYKK
jgi:hypothetical protein